MLNILQANRNSTLPNFMSLQCNISFHASAMKVASIPSNQERETINEASWWGNVQTMQTCFMILQATVEPAPHQGYAL